MKERILRLAAGDLPDEGSKIECSVELIEEEIAGNELKYGKFYLEGEQIKGLVYSTNYLVKVEDNTFSGNRCRIGYVVSSVHMNDGEEIAGEFQVVSEGQEFCIPYLFTVSVERPPLECLQTAEDFADLACHDWETAKRLCASAAFEQLPFMKNTRCSAVYRSLCSQNDHDNLLEEFLLGVKKKEKIVISADTSPREYNRVEEEINGYLELRKNTWGYQRLEIKTDGEFILTEKTVVTTDLFQEDIYCLNYRILPERLHAGCNWGRIYIHGIHQELSLDILVRKKGKAKNQTLRRLKKVKMDCMTAYRSLCICPESEESRGRLYDGLLYLESLYEQEEFQGEEWQAEKLRCRLYIIRMHLLRKEIPVAGQLLKEISHEIKKERGRYADIYCIYLYLKWLHSQKKEPDKAFITLLNRLLDENGGSEMLMLFLDIPFPAEENPSFKLARMKQQYESGCRSPWLYAKACHILNQDTDLLRVMDDFELQVLWFGAKHGIVTEMLAEDAAHLVLYRRQFCSLYRKALICLYRQYLSKEILTGICSMMIKGECRQSEWFGWYEKGVREEIGLTRLYEYYLYSMPAELDYPMEKSVLLYFTYPHTLETEARLALYANILRFWQNDGQIWPDYHEQIRHFAYEKLRAGYLSAKIVPVYHFILSEENELWERTGKELAVILPKLLFTRRITCKNPDIRQISITYEELKEEQTAVLKKESVCAVFYSEQFVIAGQDKLGRRYISLETEEPYLFNDSSLIERCRELMPAQEILMFREGIRLSRESEWTEKTVESVKELLRLRGLSDVFRRRLSSGIIRYLKEKNERVGDDGQQSKMQLSVLTDTQAEITLLSLEQSLLTEEERNAMLEILSGCGCYSKVYDLIGEYGWKALTKVQLLELTSAVILEKRFRKERLLEALAIDCVKSGQYNQTVLEYLCMVCQRESREMYTIFCLADENSCAVHDLPKRLLAQMLFGGCWDFSCAGDKDENRTVKKMAQMDVVFAKYMEGTEVDQQLVCAYLSVKCLEFLQREEEERVFSQIEKLTWEQSPEYMPDVLKLALCRYYSRKGELSTSQIENCRRIVSDLMDRNLYLSCFKTLERFFTLPEELNDKYIIEYAGNRLHMPRLRIRGGYGEKWQEKVMIHMFAGIYCKTEELLWGESLEYEIWDADKEENMILQKKGSFTCQGIEDGSESVKKNSRRSSLNRMIQAADGKDMAELSLEAARYAAADEMVSRLFKLM